jgi:hypothetical protein
MDPQSTESLGFDEDEDRTQRICNAIRMLHLTFSLGMFEGLKFNKKIGTSLAGPSRQISTGINFPALSYPGTRKLS